MSEVEKMAEISARISHDHPEGVAGAKAVYKKIKAIAKANIRFTAR